MELEEFLGIIVATQSPDNEIRTAAIERQNGFLEENPLNFIAFLIEIIQKTTDAFNIKIAAALLYSVCIHCDYLIRDDILALFFENFVAVLPAILSLDYIDETIKNIICNIVSEVIISLYKVHPENSQIQEFLIQTIESCPQISNFILKIISETLFSSVDYCNFNPEQLIQFINLEIDNYSRVKLYFAIATFATEEQEYVHSCFEGILGLVDESGDVANCFKVISRFAEKNTQFLYPHIELFTNYICNTILTNESAEVEGLYILQSMADNNTDLFSCPLFYRPFFDTMIKVMSQITEDSQYDFDWNDDEPCAIARGIVQSLNLSSKEITEYLLSVKESVIDSGEESDLVYGVLLIFSEIMLCFRQKKNDNEEEEEDDDDLIYQTIISQFSEIAVSEETTPRIKYAAYAALNNIVRQNPLKNDITSLIEVAFQQVSVLDIKEVCIECLKFICSIITNTRHECIAGIYGDIYSCLVELIKAVEDEDMLSQLIKILGVLIKQTGENKQTLVNYEEIGGILVQIYDSLESFDVKASVIQCFCNLVDEKMLETVEGTSDIVLKFFEESIAISEGEDTPPKIANKLSIMQNNLCCYLGENFASYEETIMQECFSVISEIPEGEEFSIFDQFVSSGYYYIPNSKPGTRYCYEKTYLEKYTTSLSKISTIVSIMGGEFSKYIENVVPLLLNILSQEQFIEPVRTKALVCLVNIILSQKENVEGMFALSAEIFPKIVAHLSLPLHEEPLMMNDSLCSIDLLFNTIDVMYNEVPELRESTAEQFVQFLESLKNVKEFFEAKLKQSNKDIFVINKDVVIVLDKNLECMKFLEQLIPEVYAEFYCSSLEGSLLELALDEEVGEFQLPYIMNYINLTKSEEVYQKYKELLFTVLSNGTSFNSMEAVLRGLVEFTSNVEISKECAAELYEVAKTIFDNDISEDSPNVDFYSRAILNILLVQHNVIEDREEMLYEIGEYTLVNMDIDYNYVLLKTICYIINDCYDEFFSGDENDDDLEDLMTKFFLYYFRSEKDKWFDFGAREFLATFQAHEKVRVKFNKIRSDSFNSVNQGIKNFYDTVKELQSQIQEEQ